MGDVWEGPTANEKALVARRLSKLLASYTDAQIVERHELCMDMGDPMGMAFIWWWEIARRGGPLS
jgi:hypothetical protein